MSECNLCGGLKAPDGKMARYGPGPGVVSRAPPGLAQARTRKFPDPAAGPQRAPAGAMPDRGVPGHLVPEHEKGQAPGRRDADPLRGAAAEDQARAPGLEVTGDPGPAASASGQAICNASICKFINGRSVPGIEGRHRPEAFRE